MSEDVGARLARAHAELQALADEHVDDAAGMGQDIALSELNVLRDAAQDLWDEEPLLSKTSPQRSEGSRPRTSCGRCSG